MNRNDRRTILVALIFVTGCGASLPTSEHDTFQFPGKGVYLGKPKREFETIGSVKDKVNFETIDPRADSDKLCRNYYNKAVKNLLKMAQANGGDAVMMVRSVVLLEDGRFEKYKEPECYDDGAEGQILVEGVALRWKKQKDSNP